MKTVTIPVEELENLLTKNRRQAQVITALQELIIIKNNELDAMHFVWCDGSCANGVHRFLHNVKISDELIQRAERNVKRLRSWYEGVKWRLTQKPSLSEWHEMREQLAASKTDLSV